ncbi:MAG: NADH-quinone oxidoreductase subunit C [Bacteroidetes bacterium]|nr:NADH-quinone oxidoreductase subunit C [Bacteroidota bacterium]
MNNGYLLQQLQGKFEADIISADEPYGMLTIEFNKNKIVELLSYLYNHNQLQMQFLTDVCGIHYPDNAGKELGVIYHLHSLQNNLRLRIKCFMPNNAPEIDTVSSVFASANWQERETFDFYGIHFTGHPDLRRILNVDEMDYFPLRKEYPLEDQTRTDKDDTYFGR